MNWLNICSNEEHDKAETDCRAEAEEYGGGDENTEGQIYGACMAEHDSESSEDE